MPDQNTYTYDPTTGKVMVQPPTPAAYPFDLAGAQAQVTSLEGQIATQQDQQSQYDAEIAANVSSLRAQLAALQEQLTAILALIPLTVSSAAAIADIDVPVGTQPTLPAEATVTLSDGTTPSCPATWDGGTPTLDVSTPGTYVFSGAITVPSGVTNPNGVAATANVVVAAGA
jgi:hypothetical protein